MRILLDECIPLGLARSAAFEGHRVDHVTQIGQAGLTNGQLHALASPGFDLLVTSDRHFRHSPALRPTDSMGIVCVRVTPNVLNHIQPAIEAMLTGVALKELVGRFTIVWRDRWETT